MTCSSRKNDVSLKHEAKAEVHSDGSAPGSGLEMAALLVLSGLLGKNSEMKD